MSRIANKPLAISSGVNVSVKESVVFVEGPKGKAERRIVAPSKVEIKGSELHVKRPDNSIRSKTAQGTTFRLISNMVTGVSKGFETDLQIQGVGFKAEVKGKKIVLVLGFSHPIELDIPEGITIKLGKPTEVKVSGVSKELVGLFAAKIRAQYEPEPYKGKGVRYVDEQVRRKAGKAVVK